MKHKDEKPTANRDLSMYRYLLAHGWTMANAVNQVELWKNGARDHRIADDTMGAYENWRYGE